MKKFLSFILILAMILSVSGVALAASNFGDLKSAIDTIDTGGTISLDADIAFTETISIDKPVVINGAGHKISCDSDAFTLFDVKAGGSLTLNNVVLDGGNNWVADLSDPDSMTNNPYGLEGTPVITGTIFNGIPLIASAGTLILDEGTKIQNYCGRESATAQYGGPAIKTTGGTVTLANFEFTHNVGIVLTADNTTACIEEGLHVHDNWGIGNKGGLFIFTNNTNATMTGGLIEDNAISCRSAMVFGVINNAVFTMEGGTVQDNKSTKQGSNTAGAPIVVESGGKFVMNGGSIINNKGHLAGAIASRWTTESHGTNNGIELNGGVISNNTTRSNSWKNATVFTRSDITVGEDMIVNGDMVSDEATLTNNGTINGNVTVQNKGSLTNNGIISGSISNNLASVALQLLDNRASVSISATPVIAANDINSVEVQLLHDNELLAKNTLRNMLEIGSELTSPFYYKAEDMPSQSWLLENWTPAHNKMPNKAMVIITKNDGTKITATSKGYSYPSLDENAWGNLFPAPSTSPDTSDDPQPTVTPTPNPTEKPQVTPKPTEKPASSGIKVEYEGGNSFSTSKSAVPTSVEIDGVPVSFIGDGKYFTVGCIDPDAQWVTVRWNSTSVTTNFTPDVTVACPSLGIPKTGDMPVWAAIAAFFGF